jgi:U4/U6.U5 tri-snRNP component SNU23
MSSNLNYKQVTNVARRTWDVEAYEKRAKQRSSNDNSIDNTASKRQTASTESSIPLSDINGDEREEFVHAASGAAGPQLSKRAFLKARTGKVDSLIDAKIGSVEIIHPDAAAGGGGSGASAVRAKTSRPDGGDDNVAAVVTKSGVGWHCKICDCFLKDSHTYLDHINGRKHQRNLGYSMRVERSTKDQVLSRLTVLGAAAIEKKKSTKELITMDDEEQQEDYFGIVHAKDDALRQRQEDRKRERKERKKRKKEQQQQKSSIKEFEDQTEEVKTQVDDENNNGDYDYGEEGGVDPQLAALMGFSGFRGGKNTACDRD